MINNQPNFDKKNYVLAIVLSLVILMGWGYFFQPPTPQNQTQTQTNTSKTSNAGNTTNTIADTSNQQITEKILNNNPITEVSDQQEPEKIIPKKQENTQIETVTLNNEQLEITLSSHNAVITSAILKLSTNQRSRNLETDSHSTLQSGRILFVDPELNYEDLGRLEDHNYLVNSTKDQATFQNTFVFGNKNLTVIKKYTLKDYQLKLDISFNGLSDGQKVKYSLVNGSSIVGFDKNQSYFDIKQLAYNIGSDFESALSPGILDMFSSPQSSMNLKQNVDWISIDDRFFARILKISETSKLNQESIFFFKKPVLLKTIREAHPNQTFNAEDIEAWQYLIGGYQLATEKQDSFEFHYIPKKRDLLNQYYDQKKEYFFNLFHQFKFMRVLSSMMYWVLQELYFMIGNYGWAILLMTFLLKLVILPLTQRSMKSMEKMKLLSPKIEALKKNHKKDAKKLNQEMMALYKREGVNPLGGCLPMLIPLPIFLALYSLFQNMVELQGRSFYWIDDLSLPDVIFQLDSELPFIGQNIHLLPIIMTITAFVQSLTSPQTSSPGAGNEMKQQMIMMKYFMPLFFFFISWNMPSALILYWTMQNAFSVGQTLFIRSSLKQTETAKETAKLTKK